MNFQFFWNFPCPAGRGEASTPVCHSDVYMLAFLLAWSSLEEGFSAIRAVSWKHLGSANLSAIRAVLLGIGCFLITLFKDSLGVSVPHWSLACRYLQNSEALEEFIALSMSSFLQQTLLNPQLYWSLCFFGINIRFTWYLSICTFLIDNYFMSYNTIAFWKSFHFYDFYFWLWRW